MALLADAIAIHSVEVDSIDRVWSSGRIFDEFHRTSIRF